MRYSSAQSFRQAVEDRLRKQYPRHQLPRLRKMIAFERFMARLDDRWILKGGYALQLRTDKARTTQDIDLLVKNVDMEQIGDFLLETVSQDSSDHFGFLIERANVNLNFGNVIRFQVTARLAGRVFEQFHIDISFDDPIYEPLDYLTPPALLEFAGIVGSPIPCYSATQHIAEKLHALVCPRPVESSRIKDLVDLLIFASLDEGLHAEILYGAIKVVFDVRGESIPDQMTQFPDSWKPKFAQFTQNLDLHFLTYEDGVRGVESFINPILGGLKNGTWDPKQWIWGSD